MTAAAASRSDAGAPRLYAIPAGVSFLDALADGVLRRFPDPLALADVRILLPNRRSARALEAAFVRRSGAEALILPRIEVLGDLEEEVLEATLGRGQDHLVVPPAIGDAERLVLLAPLVARFLQLTGRSRPAGAEIHALSRALARLADSLALADADLSGLESLVPEDLSRHWQQIATFLGIVRDHWPEILAARGRLDRGARQVLLLRALKEAWAAEPPAFPVIAAGSTGSVPATAELLALVARLPDGCVVLPALDSELDDEAWAALAAEDHLTHPQYQMARLLERIGCTRAELRPWPVPAVEEALADPALGARRRLLTAALHPRALHPLPADVATAARDGLTLIACHDRREEALVAALLLRETLERPGRTAAVVTPDRALADAVHAELQRWGITVDDSAGEPLTTTPVGGLVSLSLEVVAEDFAPVPLLALLKHPLLGLGETKETVRAFARRLDAFRNRDDWLLRGPRVAGGLGGLIREAERLAVAPEDLARLRRLAEIFAPFASDGGDGDARPLGDWVAAHLAVLEALAADETGAADRLWAGEAGEAAARLFAELGEAGEDDWRLTLAQYQGFLAGLMAETPVRRPWGGHPRLMILGTIEARLLQPDRLVLAGLNEGSWPPAVAVDPWLNRRMRAAIGLPQPERRIGQSAHDFYAAAAAPEVFLLRAEKIDGVQTTPARWLQRLSVLVPDLAEAGSRHPMLRLARGLDRPAVPKPAPVPAPSPPPELRPKEVSVTAVEMLMRDPYSFFARHILALRALEELDADPHAGTRGILLHAILHRYMAARQTGGAGSPEAELARLVAEGEKAFAALAGRPQVQAVWWPRFLALARAFIDEVARDEEAGRHALLLEREGRLTLLDGRVTLTARADCIDRLEDGPDGAQFVVVDYKTGELPAPTRMRAGFAPQLPLEGWILERGGFAAPDGTPLAGRVAGLEFWKLKGHGRTPLERAPVKDPTDRIADAAARAPSFLERFLLAGHPFLPAPHEEYAAYPEYRHLLREEEWRVHLEGQVP